MMRMPPLGNPAMMEASDKYRFRNPKTGIEGLNEKTYRTVTTNSCSPRRRGVHYPEMLLYAVRTSRRFGNQMSGRRF